MKNKKVYLKVKDKGQGFFSSERILEYNGMKGFFDNGNIKNGRLEATLLEEQENFAVIIVPQFFEEYGELVGVRKADLEYAA